MAMELVAGAVLGTAVSELYKAVENVIGRIKSFRPELERLKSTLATISPRLEEIVRLNKQLAQSGDDGIHALNEIVLYGRELVLKCIDVPKYRYDKRIQHAKLLVELDKKLLKYFTIELQLEQFRQLLKVQILLNKRHSSNHVAQPNTIPAPAVTIKPGYEAPSYASHEETDTYSSRTARDLAIEWINNRQYWNWSSTAESSSEVAELLKVYFFHVSGDFETELLDHGIEYKVVIAVMLIDSAKGWSAPVEMMLSLPDGSITERRESFSSIPKNQWFEITVGTFTMSPFTAGTIMFSLKETRMKIEKTGLLIKYAAMKRIEPEVIEPEMIEPEVIEPE